MNKELERSQKDCPDPNVLLAYVWELEESRSPKVAHHLDGCSICRGVVKVALQSSRSVSKEGTAPTRGLAAPWLGTSERYVLVEECGRGAQSNVFVAYDRQLGRAVALKEFGNRSGGTSRVGTARFVREASIASSLEHPNIPPVHELGQQGDGTPFYTMRLVRGQTLAAAVRGCSSLRERLQLLPHVAAACEAVAYAHQRNVIHRDLKPANVMINEQDETFVLDWGLAKRVGEEEVAIDTMADGAAGFETLTGTVLGTPAFMSPEQARADATDIDARTDIWGLGALLYFVIVGEPPFGYVTPEQLIEATGDGAGPALPVSLRSEVAPELNAILQRALQPDRAERYADAGRLGADLRAYETGGVVSAYRYPRRQRARRFARKHRVGVTLVAAGAVWVGATFGVRSVRQRMHEQRCEQEIARIDSVWSAEAREDTLRSLAPASSALRAASLEATVFELDVYAEDWRSEQAASCEARGRGEISESELELRFGCMGPASKESGLFARRAAAAGR